MSLDVYLDNIGKTLRENLPGSIFIAEHFGDVGVNEIKKYSVKAPAIIVSTRGIREAFQVGSGIHANIEVILFVITKPKPGLTPSAQFYQIATTLYKLIPYQTFGVSTRVPTDMRTENLYDAELEKIKLGLNAFEFVQTVQINKLSDCDIERLDDYLRQGVDTDSNIVSGSYDPDGTAELTYTIDVRSGST